MLQYTTDTLLTKKEHSWIRASYELGINPLPTMRKKHPNKAFMFASRDVLNDYNPENHNWEIIPVNNGRDVVIVAH